jgi:hypothetical protein
VRVLGERRAPCVEYGRDTDARAEALGVGRDGERRLGCRLHQQVVDHALVLVCDVTQLARQRVDDVEVRYRQKLRLAVGQPSARLRALTLGAMPVTAGVIRDHRMAAGLILAAPHMPIALITFNWSRLTCPRLASRQAGPWSRKISATSRAGRAMARGAYGARGSSVSRLARLRRGAFKSSSGLSILAIIPVATRV